MMQEIITWIVIFTALAFLVLNMLKVLKLFKRPDPCKGCGKVCDSCPIYMKGE